MSFRNPAIHPPSSGSPLRRLLTGLLWLAAAVASNRAAEPVSPPDSRSTPGELRMAFSQQLFREFNPADGLAANKAWLQSLTKKYPAIQSNRTFLIDGLPALEKAAQNQEFDLVMILAVEFLALEQRAPLEPWFTFRRGGADGLELVLVTPANGAASLEAMRGKRLAVYSAEHSELAALWIETLLQERQQPRLADFFGDISTDLKPTKVVLPVFFGQRDGCIVTRDAFNVMGEMNPQVARQLTVRNTSPPLLAAVLCAQRKSDPELLRQMHEALTTAHQDTAAKQILTTFRIEKLDPFDPTLFENVRRLVQAHERLHPTAPAGADQRVPPGWQAWTQAKPRNDDKTKE